MKTERPSEYFRLEQIYIKECPETGFFREQYDGVNFCMYQGKMSCPYKKIIKPEDGAGFLCTVVVEDDKNGNT